MTVTRLWQLNAITTCLFPGVSSSLVYYLVWHNLWINYTLFHSNLICRYLRRVISFSSTYLYYNGGKYFTTYNLKFTRFLTRPAIEKVIISRLYTKSLQDFQRALLLKRSPEQTQQGNLFRYHHLTTMY